MVQHERVLSEYGATTIRLTSEDGQITEASGSGGSLSTHFAAKGWRILAGLLSKGALTQVDLIDGELEVRIRKTPDGALLSVQRGGALVTEQNISIPLVGVSHFGAWFKPDSQSGVSDTEAALKDTSQPLFVVEGEGGETQYFLRGTYGRGVGQLPLIGQIDATHPAQFGASSFLRTHGVKWAYISGAMAGGIASAEMVIAMAQAGLLGFFGAGGLPLTVVEEALEKVSSTVKNGAWGFNLLHNPVEPAVEERTVELYLQYGVERVSASAYMGLTPAIVRYRLHGIHRDANGDIVCPNKVFAKVSRPEVAEKFIRPAPEAMLLQLLEKGVLTEEQVELAKQVPIAEDITAEADSGGHTDHRPLLVLLPVLQRLRKRIQEEEGYSERGVNIRVGAAGGLGTPEALWGAFAMGADYVLTGSVNQAAVEAGTSDVTKTMLADASFFDVATGPAPDMFEIGAKVQVLSRGSMYAGRAQRLRDIYLRYESMDDIPTKERDRIEKQMFKDSLENIWAQTKDYWSQRDSAQVERAERDPHHKMALVFRWYLGMTSRWARMGTADRRRDFQVWCGPSMGGFNDWARGGGMEDLSNRTVAGIAESLMEGVAVQARIAMARRIPNFDESTS